MLIVSDTLIENWVLFTYENCSRCKLTVITNCMCQLQINQGIKQIQKDSSLKGKPKASGKHHMHLFYTSISSHIQYQDETKREGTHCTEDKTIPFLFLKLW